MQINTLTLTNFRNYTNQSLNLSPNLNVIIGKNAQGKTNLLESVFLCAIGKSPRTTKDKDLIKWDSTYAKISLEIAKKIGKNSIDLYLFTNQNKAIKIDKIGIKKIGQLLGTFNAIYFSPDELKLIKDSPDERRRFMDIDLSQFDRNYFYSLNHYNQVLQQRNKLLKSGDEKTLKDTLPIWDEQLAGYGASIIMSRLKLIENLKVHAKQIHKYLTSDTEELELSYVGYIAETENQLKEILTKKLHDSYDKDIHLGYTTVGPHRDDIKISSNGIDLRSFGSQGQQRTASLTLKLAELETFYTLLGEYPVLLLDDVLSELDESRQTKLLKYISKVQTLLTCTDFEFNVPHTKFFINNGSIEKITKTN